MKCINGDSSMFLHKSITCILAYVYNNFQFIPEYSFEIITKFLFHFKFEGPHIHLKINK